MNAPLSTLSSRALNAPSEAEYRALYRKKIEATEMYNAHLALNSRPLADMDWHIDWSIERDRLYALMRDAEQAVHSFKDAGVGK